MSAVHRDHLTDADREMLAYNDSKATECLEALVDARRRHIAGGCTEWWCAGEQEIQLLEQLRVHELHQLVAVAIHQLAQQETP